MEQQQNQEYSEKCFQRKVKLNNSKEGFLALFNYLYFLLESYSVFSEGQSEIGI